MMMASPVIFSFITKRYISLCLFTELLIGFTTMRLDIKEGRSDTAEIAILTEGEVAATVSGQMLVSSSGTAESKCAHA